VSPGDGPTPGPRPPAQAAAQRPHRPLLHIVLHEPEIPNNTGNIGRSCVALGASLHLIHPLGFEVSEKACRRAGLDYWPRLDVRHHQAWGPYTAETPGARRFLFTARAATSVFDVEFRPGDHLVFGRESVGLPAEIVADPRSGTPVGLPMLAGERSLNVATVVCVGMYEAVRQFAARGLVGVGPGANGLEIAIGRVFETAGD
jgi:tRNA (cytidine/uridine-2'-O-)-methyltransferase